MANSKISDLTEVTSLADEDTFVVVDSSSNESKKLTTASLSAKITADTSALTDQAEDAKDDAETARDAAFANASVYSTIALGRAAVADGEQFMVVDSDEIVRYTRDSASTETEVARYPTSDKVNRIENPALDVIDPETLLENFKSTLANLPESGTLDADVTLGTSSGTSVLKIEDLSAAEDVLIGTRDWYSASPNSTVEVKVKARIVGATSVGTNQAVVQLTELSDKTTVSNTEVLTVSLTDTMQEFSLPVSYTTSAPFKVRPSFKKRSTYTDATGYIELEYIKLSNETKGSTPGRRLTKIEDTQASYRPSGVVSLGMAQEALPIGHGTKGRTPIIIDTLNWYNLQPMQQTTLVESSVDSPKVDLGDMTVSTSATCFVEDGQTWTFYAGDSTTFFGTTSNTSTVTGPTIVSILKGDSNTYISSGTFSTATPTRLETIAVSGQSNAKLWQQYGGVGGLEQGIRATDFMTIRSTSTNNRVLTMDPDFKFVQGATGSTSVLKSSRSDPTDDLFHVNDDSTLTDGPALTTWKTAQSDAVALGYAPAELIIHNQREGEGGAMQQGTNTVAEVQAGIEYIFEEERDHLISLGATNPQIIVVMGGTWDFYVPQRTGMSRIDEAYLKAIDNLSYVHKGPEAYDLWMAWRDVHFNEKSYHAIGRRLAQTLYNLYCSLPSQGSFDPTGGTFPSGAKLGDHWQVSADGAIGSLSMTTGQTLMCMTSASDTTTDRSYWETVDLTDTYDEGPVVASVGTPTLIGDIYKTTVTISNDGSETIIYPVGNTGVNFTNGVDADIEGGSVMGFGIVASDDTRIDILKTVVDPDSDAVDIYTLDDPTGATLFTKFGWNPEARAMDFIRDDQFDPYTRYSGLPLQTSYNVI